MSVHLRECVCVLICLRRTYEHVCVCGLVKRRAGLGAARADEARESRGQLRTPRYVTSTGDCRFAFVRMCVCASHIVSLSMHVFLRALPHALTPPCCDF